VDCRPNIQLVYPGIQWITDQIFIWCMQGSGRLPIGYSLIGLGGLELNMVKEITMYNLADVCWDILNNIMSSYYLHNYRIFGLNGLSPNSKPARYSLSISPFQQVNTWAENQSGRLALR
jgi:hypothetical protein